MSISYDIFTIAYVHVHPFIFLSFLSFIFSVKCVTDIFSDNPWVSEVMRDIRLCLRMYVCMLYVCNFVCGVCVCACARDVRLCLM